MKNFNIFYKYLQKNIFYLIYILFYLIARKEIEIWNKFILSMLSNNLYKSFLETMQTYAIKKYFAVNMTVLYLFWYYGRVSFSFEKLKRIENFLNCTGCPTFQVSSFLQRNEKFLFKRNQK